MKRGWRKITCLAIAALAMVFAFATCTINIDSLENDGNVSQDTGSNTEQGGEATHEWDNGKITKAATENDDGEKTFTCTKCGETRTEVIPALGHKHTIASEWSSDEAVHWHEASCGKEEHRADKAAHVWNEGETTKAATENDDGEKAFTCTTCGKTKTEAIPALGHEHTIASEWTSDEALHWHEASCGKEEHRAEKAAHEWNEGAVTTEPTCTAEGETTYTCTVCGKTRTESIAATGHEWNAGEITKAATENDDGEKTFTCTKCGETRTEAIPALNHEHTIANEWSSDETYHWYEASCGRVSHRTNETEHTWDTGKVTTEPTCTTEGERTYTCTVCGRTRSESIAAKGHSYSTTWKSDASKHWKECTSCGNRGNSSIHAILTNITLTSDGERSGICPQCRYKNTSAWTKDTLSELSAALNNYTETNEKAKVKITGTLSDANITTISELLKQFSKDYGSSKQIDLDLSGTTGLKITEQMFYECTSLTNVTLPNSLTTIETYAFDGCASLASVTLPNSLTTIERCAFYECASLTSITIPDNVTTIGDRAFEGCTNLASVTLPNSLTTIETYAFYECTSLASITIPKSVTEIGYKAFYRCKKLEKVEGMEGVTIIGVEAFVGCQSLKTIRIPPSVTEIGEYAFDAAYELETIELCEGLKKIDICAFRSCYHLRQIEIPSSVNFIGSAAFDSCSSVKSIKFKDTVGWKYRLSKYATITYEVDVSDDKIIAEKLIKGDLYGYDLLKE